jgi:hypothetical protein
MIQARHETPVPRDEPGVLLGLLLIGVLVVLLLAALAVGFKPGPMRPGPSSVFADLYVMTWGFMFLGAYFFSQKTFFFRALIWFCEHFSFPPGRGMALFYFALAFILGGVGFLSGLGVI